MTDYEIDCVISKIEADPSGVMFTVTLIHKTSFPMNPGLAATLQALGRHVNVGEMAHGTYIFGFPLHSKDCDAHEHAVGNRVKLILRTEAIPR